MPPVIAAAVDANPIFAVGEIDAALLQLEHEGLEMLGTAARDSNVAARDRTTEQQRTGHDAIGNDLVLAAGKFFHAFNRKRIARRDL